MIRLITATVVLLASQSFGSSPEGVHQAERASTVPKLSHLRYTPTATINTRTEEGVRFSCNPEKLEKLQADMDKLFAQLNVDPTLVVKKVDSKKGTVLYTLNTPKEDTSTVDLAERPQFKITQDEVELPVHGGGTRKVKTVSKKEILLALLQHGRLTAFSGKGCDVQALKDNIGIRQNIVAWTQDLKWGWPADRDDGRAYWNEKYWKEGTPLPGVPLHTAFLDTFLQQEKYGIGCYTASKLAMTNGILDYYARIKKDPATLAIVEKRLNLDKDPLVSVEPRKMWSFEADFDPKQEKVPGKVLKLQAGVAPRNIIPGDWLYFLNTDPVTYQKTGYEGSNAISLGRNLFDDFYYDEHGDNFTYHQKMSEVYQWRNKVFNRARDKDKIQKLTEKDFERLSQTPDKGGIELDIRVSPYFFGYEELDRF